MDLDRAVLHDRDRHLYIHLDSFEPDDRDCNILHDALYDNGCGTLYDSERLKGVSPPCHNGLHRGQRKIWRNGPGFLNHVEWVGPLNGSHPSHWLLVANAIDALCGCITGACQNH